MKNRQRRRRSKSRKIHRGGEIPEDAIVFAPLDPTDPTEPPVAMRYGRIKKEGLLYPN